MNTKQLNDEEYDRQRDKQFKNDICVYCNKEWGEHIGLDCPEECKEVKDYKQKVKEFIEWFEEMQIRNKYNNEYVKKKKELGIK